jgi:hypothetical protein
VVGYLFTPVAATSSTKSSHIPICILYLVYVVKIFQTYVIGLDLRCIYVWYPRRLIVVFFFKRRTAYYRLCQYRKAKCPLDEAACLVPLGARLARRGKVGSVCGSGGSFLATSYLGMLQGTPYWAVDWRGYLRSPGLCRTGDWELGPHLNPDVSIKSPMSPSSTSSPDNGYLTPPTTHPQPDSQATKPIQSVIMFRFVRLPNTWQCASSTTSCTR